MKSLPVFIVQTYWSALFWLSSATQVKWIKARVQVLAFRDIVHIGGSWTVEEIEDLNPRSTNPDEFWI
jgi:hypothetical protein